MALKTKINPEDIGNTGNKSNYLNDLKDLTELKFRIIGDVVQGYEYWQDYQKDDGTLGKRPVRSELYPVDLESPSTNSWDGKLSSPKEFLAMAIYDFADESIKIWSVTKKDVTRGLVEIELDDDLGEMQDYDFKVKKTGQKMDTKYSLMRLDKSLIKKEMTELYEEANVSLDDYMAGKDAFGKKNESNVEDTETVSAAEEPADIPF